MASYQVDIFTESGKHSWHVHNATSCLQNRDVVTFFNGDATISTVQRSERHTITVSGGPITCEDKWQHLHK